MLLPHGQPAARATLVRASDEALLVRGPGATSTAHAHHWWHLLVGLDAPLRASGPEGVWQSAAAILTPPGVVHAVEAEGDVALLFVEPDSRTGASLAAACDGATIRILDALETAPLAHALGGETADVVALLLRTLGAPEPAPPRFHPGITRVIRHLERSLPEADVSLAALAPIAGLSEGRLMHAFTEHVGLPLRAYVRWLRVRHAAGALLGGASAAAAAHGAGFSDAAHMTRTFREMFGVTPSELARRSQSVQSH